MIYIYNVAIYLRLSKEDTNKNNSIENQQNLIYNFINKNDDFKNCNVYEYIDNGATGTDFNRIGVQNLLKDVKSKKINCIIVKDLSRFGRNYIQVGNYLENIFPFFNIRFISINDNFDNKNNLNTLEVNFRNIIYDYYSKDLSQKIISSKNVKAKNGNFLGSKAPFGYVKGEKDRRKLEIDKESSEIVKKIFKLFLEGNSCSEIANILNKNNIKTPITFIDKTKQDDNLLWKTPMVRKILENKVYIGTLEYGKTSKSIINQKRTIYNNKKDWIITENAHENIVSKEDFDRVQSMLKHNKKHTTRQKRSIFAYKIYCGHCGYALTYSTTRYYCKNGKYNEECKNIATPKEKLDKFVLEEIKKIVFEKFRENIISINDILKKYEKEICKLKNKKISAYEQYATKNIDRNTCIQTRQNIDNEIALIKNKIEQVKNENKLYINFNKNEKSFDLDKLTFELVDFFIEKIILKNTLIDIIFK